MACRSLCSWSIYASQDVSSVRRGDKAACNISTTEQKGMILFAFLPLGVLWVWNWYIDCEVSFQSWMSLNLAELNTELHTGNGSRVSRSSFERGYGNSRHSFLYLSSNSKWLTLYQGAGMKCTTDNVSVGKSVSHHFMKHQTGQHSRDCQIFIINGVYALIL